MKAIVFREHGTTANLALADLPDPRPGPGEVLVRVRAASLNGFDPMILGGTTDLKTPLPMIPGGDFAGDIVSLGEGVTDWREGDRVAPYPFIMGKGMMGETVRGAFCEYVAVPAKNLVRMPEAISYAQAAALPIAYGTALRMMGERGRVRAGESVLILGATGGVGTGCVQLAKAAGAEVIACGSAEWKLVKLKELGADHVIDTAKEDFVDRVQALYGKPRVFGEGGIDVVVNYLGGETWVKSLKVLSRHGRMLTCGATLGYEPSTDIRYIWSFEQTIIGSNGWTPDDQATLMEMVVNGEIAPVIHAERPLEETPAAIQELIDRSVFGKSIILP